MFAVAARITHALHVRSVITSDTWCVWSHASANSDDAATAGIGRHQWVMVGNSSRCRGFHRLQTEMTPLARSNMEITTDPRNIIWGCDAFPGRGWNTPRHARRVRSVMSCVRAGHGGGRSGHRYSVYSAVSATHARLDTPHPIAQ